MTSHEVTSHDVASKGTKHAEDAVEKNGRRPYGMGHEETDGGPIVAMSCCML